jgi:retron-type reverse transcriptase
MTQLARKMKTYNNLYLKIISLRNLILAHKKARKGKTKKEYVLEFEKNLAYNLKILYDELRNQTYNPQPLKTFILRDPKTRKISVSDFRDRIVHHALCNIIEPIFDKTFIYDSCANRKRKGTLFAINRFDKFHRKATHNLSKEAFYLKADIKHYFQNVDKGILLRIIQRKIKDEKTINLIILILNNFENDKGMPLGNLTSQFFANVYLNELDYFVKHKLKARYYIRYVDDFVILSFSKKQLIIWKELINLFLKENLKLELHSKKSKINSLSKGVDFIGFRSFYYFKLLRKRNLKEIILKIEEYKKGNLSKEKILEIFQGWHAYARWANSFERSIYIFWGFYITFINIL